MGSFAYTIEKILQETAVNSYAVVATIDRSKAVESTSHEMLRHKLEALNFFKKGRK